ncbi:NAD(P)H-dependent oxidoreductase [uncultured Erythrobacter sp.]|uniref:FMN-dependent NADH-azoreductase n=1 Tax=uncultured Erythrobacter sp. TaxID=263913 RepID=UPI002632ED4F|nr:NAD(P)H-dependent oxidoreductase [uncultured Erythrobacter sp.]
MSNILHITASIRGDESVSNALGNALVDGLSAKNDASVIHRDLAANDLPFQSWDRFNAGLTESGERTVEQGALAAIADKLIAELQAADTIVISSPIYNFGVPASVKAWADLVARAGTTFQYTPDGPKGLLEGKKAYITVVSGGTPVGADFDFMSPWLKFFLGFLGIHDVELIVADGTMGDDGEAKIAAAHAKIAEITGTD